VRGFVALAGCDAAVGQAVNIGSNHEVSIGETARLIGELMSCQVAITSDEQRLRPPGSEVERLVADNSRARALAGWTPEYAGPEGLRRGLRETIEWFREPANLRRYKAGVYNI